MMSGFANVCGPLVLDLWFFFNSDPYRALPGTSRAVGTHQVNFAQARLREMTLKDAKEAKEVKPKPDSASVDRGTVGPWQP